MAATKKKVSFVDSEEGLAIERSLQLMARDRSYNTKSSYSANAVKHPNHRISFVDKHMNYLSAHPNLDPQHYVANLRLITRIK